jgi:hypothetical protein
MLDYKIRTDEERKQKTIAIMEKRIENLKNTNVEDLDETINDLKSSANVGKKNLEELVLPIVNDIITDEINLKEKQADKTETTELVTLVYSNDFTNFTEGNTVLDLKTIEGIEFHEGELYNAIINLTEEVEKNSDNYETQYLTALYEEGSREVLEDIVEELNLNSDELNLGDLKEISNVISEKLGEELKYSKEEIEKDRKEFEKNIEKEEREY